MKNLGIVILSIGLLFTLLTTFGVLSEEHILSSSKSEVLQKEIHRQIWEPLVGGVVVIIGVGMYMMSRSREIKSNVNSSAG